MRRATTREPAPIPAATPHRDERTRPANAQSASRSDLRNGSCLRAGKIIANAGALKPSTKRSGSAQESPARASNVVGLEPALDRSAAHYCQGALGLVSRAEIRVQFERAFERRPGLAPVAVDESSAITRFNICSALGRSPTVANVQAASVSTSGSLGALASRVSMRRRASAGVIRLRFQRDQLG